jgi:hypothetical protein
MGVIMKKMLYAIVAVGVYGMCEGMEDIQSEPPQNQKLFFSCCNALATGNDTVRNETMRQLQKLRIDYETLMNNVLQYYDYKSKQIDYSQFRIHQAEILVFFSLMNYAIRSGLFADKTKASFGKSG